LHKTNVNERFFQQEVMIMIKLFLSIIFNGFPYYHFPVCIVFVFHPPEKRCIDVLLYCDWAMDWIFKKHGLIISRDKRFTSFRKHTDSVLGLT
jgi:hypothetical protein